jgi:hypothetical protein
MLRHLRRQPNLANFAAAPSRDSLYSQHILLVAFWQLAECLYNDHRLERFEDDSADA